MLVGYTFDEQLFTSEAFAKFQDTFLSKKSGVIDGITLSNTNNTVTISSGWFVVRGRFLREQGGSTLSITENGYYSVVCEIDLNEENTETELSQAKYKLIKGTGTYPILVQQDITNGGTIYQYEFAKFKMENGTISNFTDTRTFVDFESIYDLIQNEAKTVLDDIEKELQTVLDGSSYLLKTGGTANGNFKFEGEVVCDNINNSNRC